MTEQNSSSQALRKKAALISCAVSVVLLLFKAYAYYITNSQAILSDALESIINVLTAFTVLFVISYAAKPKDKEHPYGHGKVEYFSSAFEGGLITFASIMIVLEAINELIKGPSIKALNMGLIILMVAGLINLALGLYLKSSGKKNKSMALTSSGEHILSDFWTSFGVFIGLVVVHFTGLLILDSIIAIIVGVYLGYTGLKIVKKSLAALMDEENIENLKQLSKAFNEHKSETVIQVHHVKLIRSGNFHHIDAHLVVPEFWNVKDVHDHIVGFEKSVLKSYGHKGELNFHLDPCRQAYCKFCDIQDCPIRLEEFEAKLPIKLDHMRNFEEPEEFRNR